MQANVGRLAIPLHSPLWRTLSSAYCYLIATGRKTCAPPRSKRTELDATKPPPLPVIGTVCHVPGNGLGPLPVSLITIIA